MKKKFRVLAQHTLWFTAEVIAKDGQEAYEMANDLREDDFSEGDEVTWEIVDCEELEEQPVDAQAKAGV